MVLTSS